MIILLEFKIFFQIHIPLIHSRPGENKMTQELLDFTRARFVQIKLQGFRGNVDPLPKWLSQDINIEKKLFYSFKDIKIVGQCICNGHASSCRHNVASGVCLFYFCKYQIKKLTFSIQNVNVYITLVAQTVKNVVHYIIKENGV